MLIISRKYGEKIVLDNNITLTVLSVGPHYCRLGIDAPRDVPINRAELLPPREETPCPPPK